MSVIYQPSGKAGEYAEWAVNLYNGCTHKCAYCYVPHVRQIRREVFYGANGISAYKDVLKKLRLEAFSLRGKIDSPITLSFTSDPYQPFALASGITREALHILKENGFTVCILTKAGTAALADVDLLGTGDVIAASLTVREESDRRKWEPNAAPYADRLELLARAKAIGLQTWASFEPTIFPEQTLRMLEESAPNVDLAKVGPLNGPEYKSISDRIDWRQFAMSVVEGCKNRGQSYLLKNDLYAYVRGEVNQRG